MPLLKHSDAIAMYYEQVREKYPDLSYEEFELICMNPGRFTKHLMVQDYLPIISIKYLGKIVVFPSKIKKIIASNKNFLEKGILPKEVLEERIAFYQDYLKALEKMKIDRKLKKPTNKNDKENYDEEEEGYEN